MSTDTVEQVQQFEDGQVIVPILEEGKIGIRKPNVEDHEHFKECLKLDPYHPHSTPDFWTMPTGDMFVFFDDDGNRVYARIEKVLRIHMEHDPNTPRRKQAKLISALHAYFRDKGAQAGFVELIFDSIAPKLREFCKKHFGFKDVENNLTERIR